MDNLSIGEIAERAGLNTSTIRYYEEIGLLPKAKRVNGHRRFSEDILQRLALIQFAQQAGFSLGEIEILFHGFEPSTPPAERWQALIKEKLPQIDALIARAENMKRMLEKGLQCGCLSLEDCAIVFDEGCQRP